MSRPSQPTPISMLLRATSVFAAGMAFAALSFFVERIIIGSAKGDN